MTDFLDELDTALGSAPPARYPVSELLNVETELMDGDYEPRPTRGVLGGRKGEA